MKKRGIARLARPAVILFGIALICATVLGFINGLTKERIREVQEQARTAAISQVLPQATSFEEITDQLPEDFSPSSSVKTLYAGLDSQGQQVGYVALAAPKGFGGEITMIVGISPEQTVTGVVITEMSETAGLGTKALDSAYLSQYIGKSRTLSTVKTQPGDNQIAAITSATVTSKAVTAGVKAALDAVASLAI